MKQQTQKPLCPHCMSGEHFTDMIRIYLTVSGKAVYDEDSHQWEAPEYTKEDVIAEAEDFCIDLASEEECEDGGIYCEACEEFIEHDDLKWEYGGPAFAVAHKENGGHLYFLKRIYHDGIDVTRNIRDAFIFKSKEDADSINVNFQQYRWIGPGVKIAIDCAEYGEGEK